MSLSIRERIAILSVENPAAYERVMARLSPETKRLLLKMTPESWCYWGRPEQLPNKTWIGPSGFELAVICGRGWGKTIFDTMTTCWWDRTFPGSRILLVNRTADDLFKVNLNGPSGLLTMEPRAEAHYNRTWVQMPYGSVVEYLSAETVAQSARGREFHLVILDEFAQYDKPGEILAAILPTLRLKGSRLLVTTTPKPVQSIIDRFIMGGLHPGPDGSYAEPTDKFILVTGSSLDNGSLPEEYVQNIVEPWLGTAIGDQEVFGRLVLEVAGALFKQSRIDQLRVEAPDPNSVDSYVVGLDPSLTSTKKSDSCGIVTAVRDRAGNVYVLSDDSGIMPPEAWARKAYEIYLLGLQACPRATVRILYEVESLRDLVTSLFKSVVREGEPWPVLEPVSSRGINKWGRTSAIAPLINGPDPRVFFCDSMPRLTTQMTTYDGTGRGSPDALDAMTYAIQFLAYSQKVYGRDYWIGSTRS